MCVSVRSAKDERKRDHSPIREFVQRREILERLWEGMCFMMDEQQKCQTEDDVALQSHPGTTE